MQSLHHASNDRSVGTCAAELLEAVPPVMWFMRQKTRRYRRGLSVQQMQAMYLVQQQPGASLSSVAEHIGASLPTASRIVTGLVRKKLLLRGGSAADRRQLELAVTRKGLSVLNSAWSGAQQQVADELHRLAPGQRAVVIKGMRILKRTFGVAGPPHDRS